MGWYRSWGKKLKSALVLRNFGLNDSLSAKLEVRSGLASHDEDWEGTSNDFIPKTLVAAVMYQAKLRKKPLEVRFELIDFLVYEAIFSEEVYDRNHHIIGFRLGGDWHFSDQITLRSGYDRGNLCLGFGYRLKTKKGKSLAFNYALVLERGGVTFSPYSLGFRYEL